MIDAGAVRELIDMYEKHGWILRRVLLTPQLAKSLRSNKPLFDDVPAKDSTIDAAWFSRPPKQGGVPWELRYLGDIPYALLEQIDEEAPEFEERLAEVEDRLRISIAAKTNSLTTERVERQT